MTERLSYMSVESPKWSSSRQQIHKDDGFTSSCIYWLNRSPFIHVEPSLTEFYDEIEAIMRKHHVSKVEAFISSDMKDAEV